MPEPSVVVVTDSTANLSPELAAQRGIEVVPLQVVIGEIAYEEGTPEAMPERIATALDQGSAVSTSRPAPALLRHTYERVAAPGEDGRCPAVVSVHLSGDMSGTVEAAQLAASSVAEQGIRVSVVDSRQVGVATGYAVLAAAEAAAAGGSAAEVAEAARRRAARCRSWFYVDTLEHLRRGGRIGSAAALLGGALAVKPILAIEDGIVVPSERVRTSTRALARLADLAADAAQGRDVDLSVAHLANPDAADSLAETLTERLAGPLGGREVWCAEVGAVLGAHVGPGMVAVCVSPRD